MDWMGLIALISPTRPHLVQPLVMAASGVYIAGAILFLWVRNFPSSGDPDPNTMSNRRFLLVNRLVLLGLFVAGALFAGLFLLSWQQSPGGGADA